MTTNKRAMPRLVPRDRDALSATCRRLPLVRGKEEDVLPGARRRGVAARWQAAPTYFLDLTALGRQEDWEDSPVGWPQRPTYG